MSGEANNTNNTSAMEQILSMFNSLKVDNNNTNNNINSLKADIINSNNAIEAMQTANAATLEESSRATSPRQLAARLESLHGKMPNLEMPLETPRMDYTEPQVSMAENFANKKAADDFEEVNRSRAPTISLLTHSPGSQLDEHIGREHECISANTLSHDRMPD